MSRRDLLGRIARARADMMMRGHSLLKFDIGPQSIRELGADLPAVLDWPEICVVEIRADMEGFAVMAWDGHI